MNAFAAYEEMMAIIVDQASFRKYLDILLKNKDIHYAYHNY